MADLSSVERVDTGSAALQYLSIPPAAFAPMMSTETYAVGAVATLAKTTAAVTLPDGARIRELSCFGRWKPAQNSGKRMWLYAVPLADISGKEVIAKLTVGHGEGERRLDATTDRVVDNFTNAYQLVGSFNAQAELRGCRIGYVL